LPRDSQIAAISCSRVLIKAPRLTVIGASATSPKPPPPQ
jgi:hypothetical protein